MTRRSADKPAEAAKSASRKAALKSGAKPAASRVAKASTTGAGEGLRAATQPSRSTRAKAPTDSTKKRGTKLKSSASARSEVGRTGTVSEAKQAPMAKRVSATKRAASANPGKPGSAVHKGVAAAKSAAPRGNAENGGQSKMTPKEAVKAPKVARAAGKGQRPAKEGATRSAVARADVASAVPRRWEEPFKEFSFKSQNAFLTVLVNRPAKRIRVIDFRAGAMPAKRLFIQTTARQEDIHKVQIFIEKDEISAWTKVGFQREGTVPGFYKRSDGYLCGFFPQGQGPRKDQLDQLTKDSEKALVAAKRAVGSEALPEVKVFHLDGDTARKFRDKVAEPGTAYAAFEPFARDADYLFVGAGPKVSAPVQVCGVEYEECFGHAQVDFLQRADSESACAATAACMREVEAILTNKHIVSLYTYVPVDAIAWLGVLLDLGFRRTGIVPRGLTTLAGEGVDTLLMTKKLDFLDDE